MNFPAFSFPHLPGRNDPCWCGSGRKYKSCHCAFDQQIASLAAQGHIVPTHKMIKTPEQIEKIKESCKINIAVLDEIGKQIHEGMTTAEIDDIVSTMTRDMGGIPAPLNYEGYPYSVCTSVNDQVCHGIPSKDDVLKDGVTGAKVITHEVLKVNLGTHLSSLWTNARTIVGTTNYLRYDQDVYKQYAHDVYETDPVSGVPKFTIVGGKVKFNLLHAKGDYVLDKNGNKIIQYYKGDVMLDYNGDPIIRNKRSIRRRLELYLFDGRYAISDTSETKAYMEEVIETMVQYVTEDIPSLNDPLLEKTSIYLYPKSNIGLIEVLQADGTKVKVEAEQRFKVKYYLTSSARRDTQLLAALDNMGRQCIIDNLKLKTVSISNILASIRSTAGEDIVDVEMDGMGEKADQYIYTLVDETTKATIGKKLVANPDQTVAIVDDIAFSYTKHEVA